MPLPDDYAAKKIAEYLARVSASLAHLPEAERTRLLRNAENEIRAQLHKRNPSTPTQWDVDVVLASFPPPSRHAHAQSGASGSANRNAHDRRGSPLVTALGVIFLFAVIAILFLFLTGSWKTQPDAATSIEPPTDAPRDPATVPQQATPHATRAWNDRWRIVENAVDTNSHLADHHPMGWIDGELPPDKYCNRPAWEGTGRHSGILALHPLSLLKPAKISLAGKADPGTPVLCINACGNAGAGGDFILQCIVDGHKIGEYVVDASRWQSYAFDLSTCLASSTDPIIEVCVACGGRKPWYFEHAYIDSIQFKARGADAPRSNGVLVLQNALTQPEDLEGMTLSLGQYGGHVRVESQDGMLISGIHTVSAAWPKVCVGPVYEMFFDCELKEGQQACWWLGGPGHGNSQELGYVCRFNGKHALLSRDGRGMWEGDLEEPIAPGQRFGTLITRRDGRFSVAVNGRALLEASDRDPLPAALHSWIGLGAIGGSYDSGVRYKDLAVRVPERCRDTPMTLTPPATSQCTPGAGTLHQMKMTGPGLPDTWSCSQPQAVKLDGKSLILTGPNGTPECILKSPITGNFAIDLRMEYLSDEAVNFSVPVYWAQGPALDRATDPQFRLCFPDGFGMSRIEWIAEQGATRQVLAKTPYYAPIGKRSYMLRLERIDSTVRVFVDGGLLLDARLPLDTLKQQGAAYAGLAQFYGGVRLHAVNIESLTMK